MLGNDDNSIKINVNKGGGVIDTVVIRAYEYKTILELACKAAMLKEAFLNSATLNYSGDGLYFMPGLVNDAETLLKYAFHDEYEQKVRELKKELEENRAKDEINKIKENANER